MLSAVFLVMYLCLHIDYIVLLSIILPFVIFMLREVVLFVVEDLGNTRKHKEGKKSFIILQPRNTTVNLGCTFCMF